MAHVIPELAVWVDEETARAIHDRQLAEHGGLGGVRDANLLSSALARPKNIEAYSDALDLALLAAAYAFGIARNHPFADGNKRTALVVSIVFLELNGYSIEVDMAEAYQTFYDLAAGTLSEEALGEWFSKVLVRLEA